MKDTVTYKILFAVGRFGAVMLNCNDFVKELTEDTTGDRLDGLVDNFTEVPTDIGVYTGLLTIEHINNQYENEWELHSVTISGCMCLNKLAL